MPTHMMGPIQVQSPVGVPEPFHGLERRHRQVGRRRIFVQTDGGDVVDIEVDRADRADKVKKAVQATLRVPTEQSNLVFGGHVLEDDLSEVGKNAPILLTRGISRSCSSPCLSPIVNIPSPKEVIKPLEIVGRSCGPQVKLLLREAIKALAGGVNPVQATGGLGGAYYFRNRRGESIAIVKPTDEEPFAPNNPNGYTGRALGQPGLKRAIRVGEAGVREVAAYLLDHGKFASVPYTALVKATHSTFNVNDDNVKGARDGPPTKIGSFQQFVKHDFDASEHGTSRFPAAAIHRIGILDIRIFNTDRHSGNILVHRILDDGIESSGKLVHNVDESVELIPIDHGFCLPETLESAYFEWLHWPQASLPFSHDELDYIANLNVEKEVEMLRSELPMLREGCLRILVLSTLLLQRAAAEGFTLAEIGSMMSRELRGMDEEASELETICYAAKQRLEDDLALAREEKAGEVFSEDEESSDVQFPFEEEESALAEMHPDVDILTVPRALFAKPWYGEDASSESSRSSPLSRSVGNSTMPSSSSSSPLSIRGSTPPLLRLEETCTLEETSCLRELYECDALPINADKLVPAQYKAFRPRPICPKKPSPFFSRSFIHDRPARMACPQSPLQRSPTMPYSRNSPSEMVQGTGCAIEEEFKKAFPDVGAPLFGEMTERLWNMYFEIVAEVLDEALERRKRANYLRGKKLGTSCRF